MNIELTPEEVRQMFFPRLRQTRMILRHIKEGRLKARIEQTGDLNTRRYFIKPRDVKVFLRQHNKVKAG